MGFDSGSGAGALNDAELLCLNELAEVPSLELKLRFLEEALAKPEVSIRFARRAPQLVSAAVGTNAAARGRAVTVARRFETGGDVRQRVASLALLLELGDRPASASEEFEWLASNDARLLGDLVLGSDLSLDESAHGAVVLAITEALVAVLGKTTDADALRAAGTALAALAPRLAPADAPRVAEALVAVLGKTTDADALRAAAEGLAALAPRLAPADADRTCRAAAEAILKVMGDDIADYELVAAAAGLDALATVLPAEDAQRWNRRVAPIVLRRLRQFDFTSSHSSSPFPDLVLIGERVTPQLAESTRSGNLDAIPRWGTTTGYGQYDATSIISRLTTPAALAHVLRHPQCVGPNRRTALDRLEYLAFPPTADEQALHLQAALAPDAFAPLAAVQHARRISHRRFHTLWDAVAWLEQAHPEIDLSGPFKPVPLPEMPK